MKQSLAKTIALIIVIAMIVTSFSFVFFLPAVFGTEDLYAYGMTEEEEDNATERLALLLNYLEFVKENYKDEVDYDVLIDGAFAGVINALGDEFSEFYVDAEKAEKFVTTVDGTFVGIGVVISTGENGVVINRTLKGTPAEKAGLASGDIIVKVDSISMEGKTNNEVSKVLRGEIGTKVDVTVKRAGRLLDFTMVREKINEECIEYKLLEDNIGYVLMKSFDADAKKEFANACEDLISQGAKGIVLDLRDNVGGYYDQGIKIAEYILEDCFITHSRAQGKIFESRSANDGKKLELPMSVIVNGESASSSELLAGALQDNGIPLVGTTTYGKGIAQKVLKLKDGKQFKLSTMYFLTPSEKDIQGCGLTPNYVVQNTVVSEAEIEELKAKFEGFAPMTEQTKPSLGDKGLNVYAAQQRLALLGYSLETTGEFDLRTAEAVKNFQAEKGLYPYAKLDYTTMNKLQEASYNKAHGKSSEDLQLKKAIELLK